MGETLQPDRRVGKLGFSGGLGLGQGSAHTQPHAPLAAQPLKLWNQQARQPQFLIFQFGIQAQAVVIRFHLGEGELLGNAAGDCDRVFVLAALHRHGTAEIQPRLGIAKVAGGRFDRGVVQFAAVEHHLPHGPWIVDRAGQGRRDIHPATEAGQTGAAVEFADLGNIFQGFGGKVGELKLTRLGFANLPRKGQQDIVAAKFQGGQGEGVVLEVAANIHLIRIQGHLSQATGLFR